MFQETSEATREGGPGVHCSEHLTVTRIGSETQRETAPQLPDITAAASVSDWRAGLVARGFFDKVDVVTGDLGPIHVLGSPRVVVAARGNSTFVWIAPAPSRAWDNQSREFLKAPSKSAMKYAVELAIKLRAEAQREFDWREKQKALRKSERLALLEQRGRRP